MTDTGSTGCEGCDSVALQGFLGSEVVVEEGGVDIR